jgi:hypothetical protein
MTVKELKDQLKKYHDYDELWDLTLTCVLQEPPRIEITIVNSKTGQEKDGNLILEFHVDR